jgi:hypothetical protein
MVGHESARTEETKTFVKKVLEANSIDDFDTVEINQNEDLTDEFKTKVHLFRHQQPDKVFVVRYNYTVSFLPWFQKNINLLILDKGIFEKVKTSYILEHERVERIDSEYAPPHFSIIDYQDFKIYSKEMGSV